MKPWLLVAGDFVTTGGMDVANHALAGYLARSGRAVHLVAHRVDPALAALPGVTVTRVPRPLGSHALGFPLLARAGRSAAAEWHGEVLVNGGNCRVPGSVSWLHYVHAAFQPRQSGVLRRLRAARALRRARADERAAVAAARVVIANSRRTAEDAVALLRAHADQVRVVRYGVDAARYRPPTDAERAAARAALGLDERPAALFVGALGDHRKGFDTLATAWAALAGQAGWDARLLVVGSGPALPRWRAWAREAGLEEQVRFLGFQSDVRGVLWAADALVAPTRYEAYGLAVQEALCCGVPALVSARAGVAEEIPAALAPLLLDNPDDAPALAAALRRWHADRAGWAAAAVEASGPLRAWSWDDMAARIVHIVEGGG